MIAYAIDIYEEPVTLYSLLASQQAATVDSKLQLALGKVQMPSEPNTPDTFVPLDAKKLNGNDSIEQSLEAAMISAMDVTSLTLTADLYETVIR